MQIIERGNGPALVLIPSLHGRWEYLAPAVEALSKYFRVTTFSLCDEPSAAATFDPARGFDDYVSQIGIALAHCGLERAIICGISFGGVVALRFAAAHPDRTTALVLASTPGPRWHLSRRHALYARFPRIFGPVFAAESPRRLRAELAAALTTREARRQFLWWQTRTLLKSPLSFSRMARRALLMSSQRSAHDAPKVQCPTLVITGEPLLDHVVPANGSSEYLDLISTARPALLAGTGHLGSITRPDRFAAIIREFVNELHNAAA